jgi:hypothetical protein
MGSNLLLLLFVVVDLMLDYKPNLLSEKLRFPISTNLPYIAMIDAVLEK